MLSTRPPSRPAHSRDETSARPPPLCPLQRLCAPWRAALGTERREHGLEALLRTLGTRAVGRDRPPLRHELLLDRQPSGSRQADIESIWSSISLSGDHPRRRAWWGTDGTRWSGPIQVLLEIVSRAVSPNFPRPRPEDSSGVAAEPRGASHAAEACTLLPGFIGLRPATHPLYVWLHGRITQRSQAKRRSRACSTYVAVSP